ncbi:MAG: sugar ABC transporter permease [Lachnospiraceae bacterium]|nr:sugar ABC transporter permease [Lachnospiraceae bacterium]
MRSTKVGVSRTKAARENLVAYTFLLPSLVGLILFSMIPLVMSLYVSLTDWNFMDGIGNWNFIGLSNFKELWTDEWFVASLKNTLIFTIVTVPISLLLALIIAVMIDDFCHKKVAGMVRVAMYMPHICNTVAISAVWMALYSKFGPFTQLMRALGWENPPRFLADYTWALPAIMLVVIWAGLGYRIFMYSASLASLPKDLYESAEIDGVNIVQKFIYITMPLLKPTTFFLTITGIISSFKVFTYSNVMTQGGPGSSTYTLVYYIYTSAFKYYRMGYASAIAVILFLMLLIVTIIQWIHNNKNETN